MTDPSHAVRLDAVEKTYEEEGLRVTALAGITADIPRGRFVMIVGPSGSGKSTLLNLIGCIDRPSKGSVEVAGQKIAELSDDALTDFRARAVGFVFQNFNLFPVLSAYENVEYPLLLLGLGARERRERTMAMLDQVGLADQARQRPNQLSGGQKQRVAIARAVIGRPDLLLADEPTGNVDDHIAMRLMYLLDELNKLGTTVIVATHNEHLVSRLHHPRLRLENGRLRAG